MNLVIISLEMFYSLNHLCPLTYMLILEISIVNKYAEIIDRFRLSNNVQINNISI